MSIECVGNIFMTRLQKLTTENALRLSCSSGPPRNFNTILKRLPKLTLKKHRYQQNGDQRRVSLRRPRDDARRAGTYECAALTPWRSIASPSIVRVTRHYYAPAQVGGSSPGRADVEGASRFLGECVRQRSGPSVDRIDGEYF